MISDAQKIHTNRGPLFTPSSLSVGVRRGVVPVSENAAVSIGIPRGGKGGIGTQVGHADSYKITVPVLQRYIGATQSSHLNDALGARITVSMEHYDGLVRRCQVAGKAAGEALWLVTCRATRKCEEAKECEAFHGGNLWFFLILRILRGRV